jgi:hypothetical protein
MGIGFVAFMSDEYRKCKYQRVNIKITESAFGG